MHPAPALTLTLQPQARCTQALRGVGALGLVVALGWLVWHLRTPTADNGWPLVLAAAALALPALRLLLQRGALPPAGTLTWQPGAGHSASTWQLHCPPLPPRDGQLDCPLAGRHWLLLRHHGPGLPTTWLPLPRHAHAGQWHALRCAVFSPGSGATQSTHE